MPTTNKKKAVGQYYRLGLKQLVDEEGAVQTYYWCDNTDDKDLEWAWGHGKPLDDPPTAPLKLKIDFDDEDAAEFADYQLNPFMLVTERFRAVLDALKAKNVEYYPVVIDGADRFDDFPTYFAVNIVGVANPEEAAGLEIFLSKKRSVDVIVSEKVKQLAEKKGVVTLDFIELDDAS